MNTSKQRSASRERKAITSERVSGRNSLWFLAAGCLLIAGVVRAEEAAPKPAENVAAAESPMLEVVDAPTADILDAAYYATTFRFYSNGGIVSRLMIGPLRRVNLGISFDAQHVIGGGEPHAVSPAINFKLRVFDGTDYIPALAIGYDNQGMLYQESTREYMQTGKEFYLVGGHEIFVPGFEVHAGININELDSDSKLHGFVGGTWKIVSSFAFLGEYDNIRDGVNNRFNLGGRFWVVPSFNIDVAARNIGRKADRGAERIVRLNYTAHFPF